MLPVGAGVIASSLCSRLVEKKTTFLVRRKGKRGKIFSACFQLLESRRDFESGGANCRCSVFLGKKRPGEEMEPHKCAWPGFWLPAWREIVFSLLARGQASRGSSAEPCRTLRCPLTCAHGRHRGRSPARLLEQVAHCGARGLGWHRAGCPQPLRTKPGNFSSWLGPAWEQTGSLKEINKNTGPRFLCVSIRE